jgi:hypothetical protein
MFRYPTISSLAVYFSKTSNKQASVFENDIQSEKLKAGKIHQKKRRQKLQSI